jgi:HlyD family secretion protein
LLLPYLTANVRLVLSHETNVLLVPNITLRWTPSSTEHIAPGAVPPSAVSQKSSHRTLWVKEGEFLRPIEVTAGTSDGANTAVTGEGLKEGLQVVTGEVAGAAQNDVKNPFLPKLRR